MSNPNSPGVYVNIVDKSQYANIVVGDKSVVLILAESGELFKPRLITSRKEFINIYGYPKSRSAFYAYLLVGLSPVWVSRIAVINPNTYSDINMYESFIAERTGVGKVSFNSLLKIKSFKSTYDTSWSSLSFDSEYPILIPQGIKTYASGDTPQYSECSEYSDTKGIYFSAMYSDGEIFDVFDRVFYVSDTNKFGFIKLDNSVIEIDLSNGDISNNNASGYIGFYLTLNYVPESELEYINFSLKYPGVCSNTYVKVYPVHLSVNPSNNYYFVDYVNIDVLYKDSIVESYSNLSLYNSDDSNYYRTVINENSENIVITNDSISEYFYAGGFADITIPTNDFIENIDYISFATYEGLDWKNFNDINKNMDNVLSFVTFALVNEEINPIDIFQSEYNSHNNSDYTVFSDSDVELANSEDTIKSGIVNSVRYVFDRYLGDEEQYDFVRLAAPFVDVSNGILTGMIDLAEMRQDFFFVYDAFDPDLSLYQNSSCVSDATSIAGNLPSTFYGAIAWSGGTQYNSFTSQLFPQFASFALMRSMTYTDNISYCWYAPAGEKRGVVPEMVNVLYNPNKAERDVLMGYPSRVNAIRLINGVGVTVFGQKTLYSDSSALNRINVARLAIYLHKQLQIINNSLIFDLDTDDLWYTIKNKISAVLSFIEENNGIKQYLIANVTTDNEKDNNTLHIALAITPTKAIEKIVIDAIFTPQGATLSTYVQN